MIEWQYVTVGAFALVIGGVIGWYVALRRRLGNDGAHQNLFVRAVSALLLLFALAGVFQIFYFQREQAQQADQLTKTTDCQYRVNKALIEALTARQDPTQKQGETLIKMVQAVLNAKTAEETRKALQNFIDATNDLSKTRTDNPFPAIPGDCRPS